MKEFLLQRNIQVAALQLWPRGLVVVLHMCGSHHNTQFESISCNEGSHGAHASGTIDDEDCRLLVFLNAKSLDDGLQRCPAGQGHGSGLYENDLGTLMPYGAFVENLILCRGPLPSRNKSLIAVLKDFAPQPDITNNTDTVVANDMEWPQPMVITV